MQSIIVSAVVVIFCLHGYSDVPTSVGLENMAQTLRGDVRLIAMGDSFSSPYFHRVTLASLRVWPIPTISAIGCGASTGSHLFRCTSDCAPVSDIQSSDDLGYTVEREGDETYFSLPTRGLREIFTSKKFDDLGDDTLFEYKWNSVGKDFLSNGVHGDFTESGDNLAFRFLYRCPSKLSQQVEELKILDNGADVGTLDLQNGARPFWHLGEDPTAGVRQAIPRQINAVATDFPAVNNLSGLLRMELEQLEPLAGTNQYLEPAGCVYYHKDKSGNRENGFYYSYMADDSWSYYGFGCDIAGSDHHDKKFSLEQFTHWLDVTTLDRDQTVVFMWYFAPEALGYDTSYERMLDMIEQANSSASMVGLTSVQHLIVISHLLNMSADDEQTRQYLQNQQNAAFDIASGFENVAAASIYAATDETLFTGSSAIPWLLYKGFDSFEFGSNSINLIEFSNGDFLDSGNVHPKNETSAAFFAAMLGEIIRDAGCKADITSDGYINTTDLLEVIGNIGNTYVDEDINNDGIVDIQDVLLVVDGWGECWPVQAPFNTPAFRSMPSGRIPLSRD